MEPMHKINKVEVRNLQIEDYIQLSQSFKRVYADKDVFWTHEQIETLIRIFPVLIHTACQTQTAIIRMDKHLDTIQNIPFRFMRTESFITSYFGIGMSTGKNYARN